MKRSGVLKTLMLREWRHLTAVPMWIFNSLFGLLLALIGGVLLLINKNAVLAFMAQEFAPQLGVDLPLGAMLSMVLSWLVSMSCLTGCTISLEGRTLWQLKSLPVSGRDVFAAKVLLNLLLCAPVSLAVGVLAGVAVGVSGALDWLWLLLTPCAYLVLIVLVGLLGNIRWHRYDWTNETVVIKQSLGAMLPVLVSTATLPVVHFLAVAEDANALMALITRRWRRSICSSPRCCAKKAGRGTPACKEFVVKNAITVERAYFGAGIRVHRGASPRNRTLRCPAPHAGGIYRRGRAALPVVCIVRVHHSQAHVLAGKAPRFLCELLAVFVHRLFFQRDHAFGLWRPAGGNLLYEPRWHSGFHLHAHADGDHDFV